MIGCDKTCASCCLPQLTTQTLGRAQGEKWLPHYRLLYAFMMRGR
jgi:hypothetical protein